MCMESEARSLETTKVCRCCKVEKPRSEFYERGAICRACKSKRASDRYHSCPAVRLAKQQAFQRRYRANPDKFKAKERERYYGLTEDAYQAMVAVQGGKCLLCDKIKKLVVDHCHSSGVVRGLLCQRCNIQVGWFEKTTPSERERLARYLTRRA